MPGPFLSTRDKSLPHDTKRHIFALIAPSTHLLLSAPDLSFPKPHRHILRRKSFSRTAWRPKPTQDMSIAPSTHLLLSAPDLSFPKPHRHILCRLRSPCCP